MDNATSTKWNAALARHNKASKVFAETARSIMPESWSEPLAEGKWSPAQVTEHLNRTYQVVLEEIRGGKGIRIRSSWILRQVVRQTVLRSIYRKRQLPKGARAPSEIIPKVVEGTQVELVERFSALAHDFEEAISANRETGRKLTHHVFGEIELLPGIDFVAIHLEHHHRQLEGAPSSLTAKAQSK